MRISDWSSDVCSSDLIAHLDMDAFYASVELLRYPELRGLPVVIGAGSDAQPTMQADGTRVFSCLRGYVGRGVVTTSTYEARALGVFSAMGMIDRKSTRLNSSHSCASRMPSAA